jgi:hypothetical protein
MPESSAGLLTIALGEPPVGLATGGGEDTGNLKPLLEPEPARRHELV